MRVGSLHARPKKERLTGKPEAKPIGTLTLGYPATAAGVELPPVKWSPLIRSVGHAGVPVGASRASSRCLAITAFIPRSRERRRHFRSALRYPGEESDPFFSACRNSSCPK